jgi:hypothetical protein
MKRADLAVGETYLDSKGRLLIVVDLTHGWERGRFWSSPPTPTGQGVAVAYCSGHTVGTDSEHWRPTVVQLSQIRMTQTREDLVGHREEDAAWRQAAMRAREERFARAVSVVERLLAFEIHARASLQTSGRIEIDAADLGRLLDLLDTNDLRDALD